MFSFLLELIGIGSVVGGIYAKVGPDGRWKQLARRLGADVAGAIDDLKKEK